MQRMEPLWFEQTLWAPEVIEATLKLGLIAERDHAQGQFEIKDPRSDRLIVLSSNPHSTFVNHRELARMLFDDLLDALNALHEPF